MATLSRSLVALLLTPLALTPAAFAMPAGNSWGMDLDQGQVQDAAGTQPMTFPGPGVRSTSGLIGGAVEFTQAPSFGSVNYTAYDNPGSQDFAMGIVFTARAIPGTKYSGNLMQRVSSATPAR